jgi:hypothetical protein
MYYRMIADGLEVREDGLVRVSRARTQYLGVFDITKFFELYPEKGYVSSIIIQAIKGATTPYTYSHPFGGETHT